MTRASTGSWKWVEEIATQTNIQKWYIQIIDYPYYTNDVNLKEHVQCWIEMRRFCFKDVSVIFFSAHRCAADWRRWTYDRVTKPKTFRRVFILPIKAPARGLNFSLFLKNRTPPSSSGIHQMIELSLKKYMWMLPLLAVEFQPQVHRFATGNMLVLCLEGRLFELRCPHFISGRTFDGKERLKGVLGRPYPCKDRLCTLKNPSCP